MTAQQYRAVIGWFNRRPAAKRLFRLGSVGAVAMVYTVYVLTLLRLGLEKNWRLAAVFLCGTAASYLAGTALRAAINRPRPYEALGFAPLYPKKTRGKSFPSRHCFCAAAIATAYGTVLPHTGGMAAWAALILLIGVSRVLAGHHYISDVAAGTLLGAASGAGFCLAAAALL